MLTTLPCKTLMLRNSHMRDACCGDKTIRKKTTPPLGSPGGGVFPGEASRSRQRGMKTGTWNVRSLYRAGSLKAAARELGWISRRWDLGTWTGLGGPRIETGSGRL